MKKFVLSAALLFGALALSAQGVVYVAPEACGAGDGSSWDNAMANIQMAINKAKEDPTGQTDVWVKAGTYNLTAMLAIKDSVSLYGGFAGTETSVDERAKNSAAPWDFANLTILDGQNQVPCARVVKEDLEDPIVVDGFVMQHGFASSAKSEMGGGMRFGRGTTFRNSIVRDCYSDNAGGGVQIYPAGDMIGCLIENNRQETGSNGGGGVNMNTSSKGYNISIDNCVFRGNTTDVRGAAINCQGQTPYYINACTFYNNSAISADGTNTLKPGGAIYDNGNNLSVINNCVIYNNTGLNLVYLKAGKFYNNTAVYNVGGVYVAAGSKKSEICNNIVWANATAEDGITGTSISGVYVRGLVALNNYTYNPISVDFDWVLSLDPEEANTNREFASNRTNDDFVPEEGGDEIPEGKVLQGPHFVSVPSFFGAIPATITDEEKPMFLAELDAVDLHIKSESALLNAASDTLFLDADRDGSNRPQGPRADVGAYELPYYNVVIPAYDNAEGSIMDEEGGDLNDTTLNVASNSVLRCYVMTADGGVPAYVKTVASTDGGLTFNGEKTDITSLIDPTESTLDLVVTEPVMLEIVWYGEEGFENTNANTLAVSSQQGGVRVSGLQPGSTVDVFDINGRNVFTEIAQSETLFISLQQGMYIIRQGANRGKAIVK